MSTEILTLDEIVESQFSKYITHNTALRQIEAQTIRALSATTTAEPGAPAAGDVYILPTGATGTNWAGNDGYLGHYYSGAWHFYAPKEGYRLWVNDQNAVYYYDGSTWRRWTPLDVDLSSPSVPVTGDLLVYDATSGQWEPRGYSSPVASGYTRVSPFLCLKDDWSSLTALTRDTHTEVVAPSSGARALLVYGECSANSANGVTGRSAEVAIRNAGDSADLGILASAAAYEFSAVSAGTPLSKDSGFSVIQLDEVGGSFFLKLTDDAGNEGTGSYAIVGYYD